MEQQAHPASQTQGPPSPHGQSSWPQAQSTQAQSAPQQTHGAREGVWLAAVAVEYAHKPPATNNRRNAMAVRVESFMERSPRRTCSVKKRKMERRLNQDQFRQTQSNACRALPANETSTVRRARRESPKRGISAGGRCQTAALAGLGSGRAGEWRGTGSSVPQRQPKSRQVRQPWQTPGSPPTEQRPGFHRRLPLSFLWQQQQSAGRGWDEVL